MLCMNLNHLPYEELVVGGGDQWEAWFKYSGLFANILEDKDVRF